MHSPFSTGQPKKARRHAGTALLGALVILGLAACSGQTGPVPLASTTLTPTSSPTPTAAPSLIAIGSPATGAAVPVPVLVTGSVSTAAGSVTVEAQSEDGTVLCRRNIMVGAGTAGAARDWSATLAFLPPKPATAYAEIPVLLRAYEVTPADAANAANPEGAVANLAERTIRVSADLPAVVITSPACGQAVAAGSSLAVSGRTRAVEALFTLQLRGADGTVHVDQDVTSGSVNSGSGGSAGADWAAALIVPTGIPAGDYDLIAVETVATAATNSSTSASTATPQARKPVEFAVQVRVE
jgi:hypothetical protein